MSKFYRIIEGNTLLLIHRFNHLDDKRFKNLQNQRFGQRLDLCFPVWAGNQAWVGFC